MRSELAVPMIARGKLVGVLDVQSTRVKAYSEQDRAMLRLIAGRVAVSIDNARLYLRVERQNRTLKTLARLSQEFSSILRSGRIAGQDRGDDSRADQLSTRSAFFWWTRSGEFCGNHFSVRYDQRVDLDNIPLGKGITGAAAESRADGSRARIPRPIRATSRRTLKFDRDGRAADRAGSRGGRAGHGKRAHRIFHGGSSANAFGAGAADRKFGGKRPAL